MSTVYVINRQIDIPVQEFNTVMINIIYASPSIYFINAYPIDTFIRYKRSPKEGITEN